MFTITFSPSVDIRLSVLKMQSVISNFNPIYQLSIIYHYTVTPEVYLFPNGRFAEVHLTQWLPLLQNIHVIPTVVVNHGIINESIWHLLKNYDNYRGKLIHVSITAWELFDAVSHWSRMFWWCRSRHNFDCNEWQHNSRTSSDVQHNERWPRWRYLLGWVAAADVSRDWSQLVRRRQPPGHRLWASCRGWQLHRRRDCARIPRDRVQTHPWTQQRLGDFHSNWGRQALG